MAEDPGGAEPVHSDTCGHAKNVQCREVPDVAASADPEHGDIVLVGGIVGPPRGDERRGAAVGGPHR